MKSKKQSVVRYCRKHWIEPDGSISPAAFLLRPDEDYLSVHNFDHYPNNQYIHIKDALKLHFRKGDKFLKFHYLKAYNLIKNTYDFEIELKELNDSHCGIFNLDIDSRDELAAPLFCEVIDEIVYIP